MKKDLTFEEWKKQVDSYLIRKIGLSSDCLPDYCYHECWKAGDSPKDTALEALDYAKDF